MAKIIISGLASSTKSSSLATYFSYYGVLKGIEVKPDPSTGKLYGSVRFADPAAAELAVFEAASEKPVIDGKKVTVKSESSATAPKKSNTLRQGALTEEGARPCKKAKVVAQPIDNKKPAPWSKGKETKGPPSIDPKAKIHVGGLSPTTTDKTLWEYFEYYGEIRYVNLMEGYAFVNFADRSSAKQAIAEEETHIVDEKIVRVNRIRPVGVYPLFIGGLSQDTTSESLSEYFSYFGKLKEASVRTDPENGESRCWATVEFLNADATSQALAEPEHIIDGKHVHVNKVRPRGVYPLFVGGLSQNTDSSSLSAYFSHFGKLKDAKVKVDVTQGDKSLGWGIVEFLHPKSTSLALALQKHVIDKKKVTVTIFQKGRGPDKLWIGGLPLTTTSESLSEHFSWYGKLLEARVLKRRCGLVRFEDPVCVEVVMSESEHVVDGGVVEIKLFSTKPPADKIFIDGLSPKTSDKMLMEYFDWYGDIVSARIAVDPATTNRRGVVKFADPVSADLAVTEGGHIVDGWEITVSLKLPPKNYGTQLFVAGLASISQDALREYFEAFGTLLSACIKMDQSTGRSRGFGFVSFKDPEDAESVLQQKHSIDGRDVTVKAATRSSNPNVKQHDTTSGKLASNSDGVSVQVEEEWAEDEEWEES